MFKFKQSLIALAGLSLVIGMAALITPTVTQGQGGNQHPLNVNVVNPTTAPVLVRDVDRDQQPFQEQASVSLSGSSGDSTLVFNVPSGKRLIIESVTASVTLDPGVTPADLAVITQGEDGAIFHNILVLKQGQSFAGKDVYMGTHYLRAYAGPGTDVTVVFGRSSGNGSASAVFTIVGYLVNVP
jgi:hypothetical protein